MRLSDLITMSLRMFRARTMRTVLTILGMGVGISAILFLVSLGYGLQQTLLQKITTSDALSTLDVSRETPEAPRLDDALASRIGSIAAVETVIPVLEMRGQVRIEGVTLDAGVTLSTARFIDVEGMKFASGAGFHDGQSEVVITSGMAKAFGREPADLVGVPVSVSLFVPREASAGKSSGEETRYAIDTSFTVVGVTRGEENTLYFPIGAAASIPLPPATKFKVKTVSSDAVPSVRTTVSEIGLTVSSISETIDQANKVFTVIKVVLMLFGVIALIVSAIGMFNTMTIALLERTEEIGIMKSIGASPTSISLMFVMESTLMGFLGSLVGIILGLLGGETLNLLFNLVATNFGGEKADLFYSPIWFMAAVIGFGAFVGFLTGVIPARKAAKTDALEALRYK